MVKRVKVLSLALATMFLGASQAGAQQSGEPAYRTIMYSDATYTTEVGYIYPECTLRGVQYHLVGTYTYFQVDEFVGICGPGGWEPL
ncbi:hypothetical protein HPC49_24330 [Pyxidicoccus fallax]|uniref:Uncharacterized protein n=1 Tax=Pyxidicoccus fallax TaxID=394095 RepID=A0A848LLF4_9BACT|nr:hypothetical protein [Pyxidicoccus fallax]NMO18493.1 hypothetical protein [Pyxidicoccus fallax]NPC81344.1 hypothetical protein [Pyxidicoccus fallax]